MSKVYNALKGEGASEEKARKAIEAIASAGNRLRRFEGELMTIRGARSPSKWRLGFNLAMTIALLGQVFSLQ